MNFVPNLAGQIISYSAEHHNFLKCRNLEVGEHSSLFMIEQKNFKRTLQIRFLLILVGFIKQLNCLIGVTLFKNSKKLVENRVKNNILTECRNLREFDFFNY